MRKNKVIYDIYVCLFEYEIIKNAPIGPFSLPRSHIVNSNEIIIIIIILL